MVRSVPRPFGWTRKELHLACASTQQLSIESDSRRGSVEQNRSRKKAKKIRHLKGLTDVFNDWRGQGDRSFCSLRFIGI
ncbi:hypothetical protein BT96DRAFT_927357 [Gymnopus androsaceus JB14]|uniref:Uncharacterized protein n=1 Tax=Gymnopus androsaceus JB14 TaxID=1447944 RepID=A0A6A4GRP9_9AGAR|nr:hypothetical protein BT96DRAFT_927357 [Gymnopus androsaceus JB14]